MTYIGSTYRLDYSPPVATEESCKVMMNAAKKFTSNDKMQCVKDEVYK